MDTSSVDAQNPRPEPDHEGGVGATTAPDDPAATQAPVAPAALTASDAPVAPVVPGAAAPSRIRWSRYALEASTIVLSVLFALALDAAWEYRSDRARERDYLIGLQEEFHGSARELEADNAERRRILDRTEALLAAARAGVLPPVDSMGPWTASVLNYRFFTPVHAVLEDLLSSGNLGLIRSDGLRRALVGYDQERRRLDVIEERERDFLAAELEPFVVRALPLQHYLGLDVFDRDPVLAADPPIAPYRRLLADPAFAGLLLLRWERTRGSMNFAEGVDRSIRRVLERLDEALE